MSVYQRDLSRMFKLLMLKYETQIAFNKNIDKKMDRFSILELTILEYLGVHDFVVIGDIMDIVSIKRGKVLGILKRLGESGFIVKVKNDSDKRSSYVELSEKGRLVLERYFKEEQEFLNFILTDMSINEEKTIVKFLSKINQTKYMK